MGVDLYIHPRNLNAIRSLALNEDKINSMLEGHGLGYQFGGYHFVPTSSGMHAKRFFELSDSHMYPHDFGFGAVQMFGGEERRPNARALAKKLRIIFRKLGRRNNEFSMHVG